MRPNIYCFVRPPEYTKKEKKYILPDQTTIDLENKYSIELKSHKIYIYEPFHA